MGSSRFHTANVHPYIRKSVTVSTAISISNQEREIAAKSGRSVIQKAQGHDSEFAMPDATRRRHYFVLLILWAFCTYWNFDKAFHIDDTAHLVIAQWIAQNPLHPMSGTLFWGQVPEPIHVTNQPHLYFYAMAGWGSVFGWSEHSMHALQSIFSLIAIVGMYRLSVRFVPLWPLVPTSMLILSPAFVVNQNSMVDIPLLAMWLAFFAALCPINRSVPRLVASAIWCSAALLIKYTSLVLYPILLLSVVHQRRLRNSYVLLIPVATLVAWSAFNFWDYGGVHITQRKPGGNLSIAQLDWLYGQATAWLLALGAVVPAAIGLSVASLVVRSGRLASRAVGALVLGAFVVTGILLASGGESLSAELTYIAFKLIFAVSGAALLLAASARFLVERYFPEKDGSRLFDHDLVLLLAWALGAFVFIVALAPFMATRHVLLAMPPLLLLASRWLPQTASKAWLLGCAVVSIAVTSGVASSDRWYANVYRSQAFEIRRSLPPNATVWYAGHWGWQWYAMKAGMLQIEGGQREPANGDYLVYPTMVDKQQLPNDWSRIPDHDVVVRRDTFPSHLISSPAGLYISTRWRLPWSFNAGEVEVFHVVRLQRKPWGNGR